MAAHHVGFAAVSLATGILFQTAWPTGETGAEAEEKRFAEGFNPRPSLLTGEPGINTGGGAYRLVSIRARHC